MGHVEQLVPDSPEERGREDDAKKGEARDDGGDVLPHRKYFYKPILVPELCRVKRGMQYHAKKHGISRNLVQAVETLIRVCCHESKRCVLQSQEDKKSQV